MNNQFSQRVTELLTYSREEALRLRCHTILPEHLVLGMLRDEKSLLYAVMKKKEKDPHQLKGCIEEILKTMDRMPPHAQMPEDEVTLSADSARIMKLGLLEARSLKSPQAETEHILLAILKDNSSSAAAALDRMRVDYQEVRAMMTAKADPKAGMGFTEEEDDEDEGHPSGRGASSGARRVSEEAQQAASAASKETPALDKFGVDLTRYAQEGKLDPVIGRDTEIDRIAQILSRRKKNNPILIGEAGVGKSAIVEGLAMRIVQEKVSRVLFNKRVVMLDMSLVVAGTKYRGQFEERICAILNELKNNKDIIVFIDEIHTLIGAGGASGSMDAANMLKPALARGDMQCIGATTLNEYKQSIEKDGALERRFQKVMVNPSTAEETLHILQNIKDKYEEHHNVRYTDEALNACVKLTERYISERCFPDKAIDAMDEAGSRMHLSHVQVPQALKEQEKRIEEATAMKADAVKSQNFELAASYRDREKMLKEELAAMKADWEKDQKTNRETVDEQVVADVVSMMSGVPVQRVAQSENKRLASMKHVLQSKVIAQDAAIEKVTKAILRSRVGLKDPNRPIGTFLFLGPTGVGKTYLAQQLAKQMFGSTDALIRIDMSEYMEKFTVSRLIGAAPGYVGYEEGGQLTEKVRRHPYSIILLDEIEKAHAEVFNLLLQLLDEGRLTDNNGRTVDFKNTVIILTSNIGTRQLKEFGHGIGFTAQHRDAAGDTEYARSVIQKALNKTFAPEFLNRLDEIITFDQLQPAAIEKIVGLELAKLTERVAALGYTLRVDERASKFLASKGYDVQFGARPLKRAIQNYLEDVLSEFILSNELPQGSILHASLDESEKTIQLKQE